MIDWVLDIPWMSACGAVGSVCMSIRLKEVNGVVINDAIIWAEVQPSNV